MDQKVDDMAALLVKILRYNKVKFAKLTDLMEQKFGTAVAISERLIHTAYSNRLSPGALDHEALLAVVKYVNEIAQNSAAQENLINTNADPNVFSSEFNQTDADQSEIMAIKAELRGALLSVASKLLKDTDTRLHHLSKAEQELWNSFEKVRIPIHHLSD